MSTGETPEISEIPPYPTASGDAAGARGRSGVHAGAFSRRLQALIGKESVSSFARRCGLAESLLRAYLRDGRMPSIDKAAAIAAAAGVSVDWLATGHGPHVAAEVRAAYVGQQASAAGLPPLPLDGVVLAGVVKDVLEAARGIDASPEQLAARVVELYHRAVGERLL